MHISSRCNTQQEKLQPSLEVGLQSISERRFSMSSTISLSETTIPHDHHSCEPTVYCESPVRQSIRKQCVESESVPTQYIRSKSGESGSPQLDSESNEGPLVYVAHIIDPTVPLDERRRLIQQERDRVVTNALSELKLRK